MVRNSLQRVEHIGCKVNYEIE